MRRDRDRLQGALVAGFCDALRAGDPQRAMEVVEEAISAGWTVPAVQSRVIAPAMHRIGDLWESGEITVADEHLATAISEDVLGRLYLRATSAPPGSRERVLLAAAEGEHHVLGLRMAADVLEGAGYEVLYLGANVPSDALVDACRRHDPAVLALGATLTENVPAAIRALALVAELEPAPRLIVGGRALVNAARHGALEVEAVPLSEITVEAIRHVIEGPPPERVADPALLESLPEPRSLARDEGRSLGTAEHGLAEATRSAADATREAARRAIEFEQLAYRDPLTGLWNRRAYEDRLHALTGADDGASASLLMIDVDSFKEVNDRHGHDAGDGVLAEIAGLVRAGLREEDFAARIGGDEFVVLLAGTDRESAERIAERIRASVEDRAGEPPVSVSIGVAELGEDRRGTALAADRALYRAKRAGRNKVLADA